MYQNFFAITYLLSRNMRNCLSLCILCLVTEKATYDLRLFENRGRFLTSTK
jgi:hypothetical protein